MANESLKGLNVAILVTDGFEQVELTEPRKALDEAGGKIIPCRLRSPQEAAALRKSTRAQLLPIPKRLATSRACSHSGPTH